MMMNHYIKKNKLYYLTFGIVILIALVTTIMLISKELRYGPYFDDFYRINNFFTLTNPNANSYENQAISSFSIFGFTIPLMYKMYISSISILPSFPFALFKDPFVGLQVIKGIYFFTAMLLLFFITSRYDFKKGFIIFLMTISSPLFFVNLIAPYHLIIIPTALLLIYRHFETGKKNSLLFFGVFLLFLSINIRFYSTWIIASLILTSLIFFPKQVKQILSSGQKIAIVILAAILGTFNYVIYNLKNGFPSLQPLYNKYFSAENYVPIDFREQTSFLTEISNKFSALNGFLGFEFKLEAVLFLTTLSLITLMLVFAIAKLIKTGELKKNKLYLFPIANFFLIFFFILITPNTARALHYTFLTPFFEISVLSSLLLFCKAYPGKIGVTIKGMLLSILISLNIAHSLIFFSAQSPPDRYHTKEIYSLNEYLRQNNIDSENILHTEWGMYSLLYAINKGEYRINEIVYTILSEENYQEKYEVLKTNLAKFFRHEEGTLYLPVYNLSEELPAKMEYAAAKDLPPSLRVKMDANNRDIIRALNELAETYSATGLEIEKVFYDKQRSGAKVITLYKLADFDKLLNEELENMSGLKSFINFGISDYKNTEGLYDIEDSFRWSQQSSVIYLTYNDDQYLSLETYIPDINFYKTPVLQFSVSINSREIYNAEITSSGNQIINLEIPDGFSTDKKYVKVQLHMDQDIITGNADQRSLSFILKKIGFGNEKLQ